MTAGCAGGCRQGVLGGGWMESKGSAKRRGGCGGGSITSRRGHRQQDRALESASIALEAWDSILAKRPTGYAPCSGSISSCRRAAKTAVETPSATVKQLLTATATAPAAVTPASLTSLRGSKVTYEMGAPMVVAKKKNSPTSRLMYSS